MLAKNQVVTKQSIQDAPEAQYSEFEVSVPGSTGIVRVSLGYRRSTDLDKRNKPGQDYAIVRGGDGFVVGVVADGVSQSYFGNLAARFLASQLLDHLWEHRQGVPSGSELEAWLRGLEREFAPIVDRHILPEDMKPLQRGALEKMRHDAGSQTVFMAFVLDAGERTLSLLAVGDAVAIVHTAEESQRSSYSKEIRAEPAGRWSSLGNTELRLVAISESDVDGVTIKSDGARDWGNSLNVREHNRQAFLASAGEWAGHDDVSFVSAVLSGIKKRKPRPSVPVTPEPEPGHGFAAPFHRQLPSLPATVRHVSPGPLWALNSLAVAVVALSGAVVVQTLSIQRVHESKPSTETTYSPAAEQPVRVVALPESSADDFLPASFSRKLTCACDTQPAKVEPRIRVLQAPASGQTGAVRPERQASDALPTKAK